MYLNRHKRTWTETPNCQQKTQTARQNDTKNHINQKINMHNLCNWYLPPNRKRKYKQKEHKSKNTAKTSQTVQLKNATKRNKNTHKKTHESAKIRMK